MLKSRVFKISSLVFVIATLTVAAFTTLAMAATPAKEENRKHQVTIPTEDRFVPFALTIHAGDTVMWMNTDTDDHTIVSDDAFNTAGHMKLDQLIKGTDNNGGKPGTFMLKFSKPGTFVYYCRFHSHLDKFNQPVAPGPKGGIQDDKGNLGTPMMGVITILGDE